jgi:hypothetical protein
MKNSNQMFNRIQIRYNSKVFVQLLYFCCFLFCISCQDSQGDTTAVANEPEVKSYNLNSDLYTQVANSVEFEELIVATNNFRADLPPATDEEANENWDQIFTDFYTEHNPDLPFSYYVDNPDIDVPEVIESHYVLIIEVNEKWQQLRSNFNLSKEESHEIYKTYREAEL